jgi:hypothetical protein
MKKISCRAQGKNPNQPWPTTTEETVKKKAATLFKPWNPRKTIQSKRGNNEEIQPLED